MALSFGRSSVCSCTLSATFRSCLSLCTCQQLIFILILTRCHSQRVFWKSFHSLCATCFVCQCDSDAHVLLALCQSHSQVW